MSQRIPFLFTLDLHGRRDFGKKINVCLDLLGEQGIPGTFFVVADLKDAERTLKKMEYRTAAKEREIEYAEARFREKYRDFRFDTTDKGFISWEKKRVKLQQELRDMINRRERTLALVEGDHVLARRGMLVLATEEVIETHRDPVRAATDIGEVLLVMRIGGRHMQWGDPSDELVFDVVASPDDRDDVGRTFGESVIGVDDVDIDGFAVGSR